MNRLEPKSLRRPGRDRNTALRCRRDYPGLFAEGAYLPAEPAPGPVRREHVCAFVRRAAGRWALAAVPRLLTRLLPRAGASPLGPDVWQDSALLVPGLRPGRRCRNVFRRARADAGW